MQATKRGRTLSFYTIPEYETWREEEGAVGWNIKYYKGKQTGRVQGLQSGGTGARGCCFWQCKAASLQYRIPDASPAGIGVLELTVGR